MTIRQYKFTSDWVTGKDVVWEKVIKKLSNKDNFLEVGSFEGRSAIWFIENGLNNNGTITCIDNNYNDWFDDNINLCLKNNSNKNLIKLHGESYFELANLIINKKEFDLIYIDGSHIAKDVIVDACLCFKLLKKDGIIIFDDYLLRDDHCTAKIAIDLFTDMNKNCIQYLHIGFQLIIQKLI